MLAAALVEESDVRPDPALDDERRRYYRLTRLGRPTLEAEVARLAQAVSAARRKRVPVWLYHRTAVVDKAGKPPIELNGHGGFHLTAPKAEMDAVRQRLGAACSPRHNWGRRQDSGRYCGNGGVFPETAVQLTWSVGVEPRNLPGLTPWTCSKVHRRPSGREFSVRPTALPQPPTGGEPMTNDDLHVVHPRAAATRCAKMEITATVRLCATPRVEPTCETRTQCAGKRPGRAGRLADRARRRGGGPGGDRRLLARAVARTHLRRHRGAIAARAACEATARPQDRHRRQPLVGPGVSVRARTARFRA